MAVDMKARQEELFGRWRQQRPDFVSDGIVDEECYKKAPLRLVFILKEVNSPGEGNWDLIESQLKDGASKATWINMALWTHGLLNLEKEIPWALYDDRDVEFRKNSLKNGCYVNIKKSPGASVADEKQVHAEALADAEFIHQQIAIYEPQLIICAGTGDAFFHICGDRAAAWQRTRRGVYHFLLDGKTPVISCPHPAARVRSCILYYSIMDAAREVLAIEPHRPPND